jgi:serine protease Do
VPRHGGGNLFARLPAEARPVVAGSTPPPPAASPQIEQRIEAAQVAVVSVGLVVPRGGDGRGPRPPGGPSRGLGVVIDPGGYVLTTDAVARETGALEVELADGRKLAVATVRRDPLNDVAILKVDGTGLPALALGRSSALGTGEVVAVVGSRAGQPGWATRIVSTGAATGGNLVAQARGATAHGGALINLRGEVVGILTASGRDGATAAAVPVDRARPILDDLRASLPTAGARRAGGGLPPDR